LAFKASIATTLHPSKGGHFIARVATFPGNPYDGHTLAKVIPALEERNRPIVTLSILASFVM